MLKGAATVPDDVARSSILLNEARQEALSCRACALWEGNTQTVFGEGPVPAVAMFVGEAPGAQEDALGRPFVGPAGQLFDEAMAVAGIDRATVYVTNAVKHRPWTATRTGRRNRPPRQSEINACARWLDRELALVQPRIICCLGAVAGKRMLGRDFKLMEQRGKWFDLPDGAKVLATVHPSFVMLQRRRDDVDWFGVLVDDLRAVHDAIEREIGASTSSR